MNPYSRCIDAFRGRRVLVLGDVILDTYLWGKVRRISPEAPVPVVEVAEETFKLGGAANVVANLRSLGAEAWLVGLVGDDEPGRQVGALLSAIGADPASLVVDGARRTTVKTRVVAHAQQVVRVDREARGALDEAALASLCERLEALLPKADALVLSDYGKGVVTPPVIRHLRPLLRRWGVVSVVDPKQDLWHLYDGFTTIAPNHHEAAFAAGMTSDEVDVHRVGEHLLATTGVESLIITWGERGMVLFERGPEGILSHHIPTVAKEVYDVTGAGDTVVSVLALGLGGGLPLVDAAVLANYAAGVVVGEVGTACVTPSELQAALDEAWRQGLVEPPRGLRQVSS